MESGSLHIVRSEERGSDSPTIVMIHGAMDRHNSFRRAAELLESHHTVLYDRRGYGRSERAGATCDFAKHVADLAVIIEREPSVLIGHSMGGLVALHMAAVYPQFVLAVGAYEPPAPWRPWWPEMWIPGPEEADESVVRSFHERVIGPGSWDRIPESLRTQYLREGHALRNDLGVGLAGPLFDPVDVIAPVVMSHGTESTANHIRAACEFAELLADATLFVIDGAAHGAHRSHPHEFSEFVRTTVGRLRT